MVALRFVTAHHCTHCGRSCRCWLRPRFLETESNFDGIKVDLVSELMDKVLECIDAWMEEKIIKSVFAQQPIVLLMEELLRQLSISSMGIFSLDLR